MRYRRKEFLYENTRVGTSEREERESEMVAENALLRVEIESLLMFSDPHTITTNRKQFDSRLIARASLLPSTHFVNLLDYRFHLGPRSATDPPYSRTALALLAALTHTPLSLARSRLFLPLSRSL